jgi:NAD/NADP transhydrogenase alpha subunit
MKIAFIGLGVMGYPMAGHLARAGHRVTVYNRSAAKAAAWCQEFADSRQPAHAPTPREAVKDADIVITTALIPGKKAPRLVTADMIKNMKQGSVILDMAVEQGGNVEGSQLNETIEINGVTIIGESNIPSLLPTNASELYARNMATFLYHLTTPEGFKWELEEEITAGSLIVYKGDPVHASAKFQTLKA